MIPIVLTRKLGLLDAWPALRIQMGAGILVIQLSQAKIIQKLQDAFHLLRGDFFLPACGGITPGLE
mgnify:CR=1 FL=1